MTTLPVSHKEISLLSTLLSLLILSFIVVVSSGLGFRICNGCRLLSETSCRSDRFLFSMAIGLGSVSILVYGVGLSGLLYPVLLYCLLGLIGLFCWRQCAEAVKLAWRLAGTPFKSAFQRVIGASDEESSGSNGSRWWGVWLLVVLALAVVHSGAILIGALAPPADSAYDVLTYHFGVPALYLHWHQIRYDPYIMHSNFPQVTEMLYLVALAGRAQGGQALHFIFGLLAAGVCWSLARRYGKLAAIVAMLTFWFTPVVSWEASVGYDDLSFAFFQSLAFLAVLRWGDQRTDERSNAPDSAQTRWLVLAGICQGLSLGVKYSALALLPLLLLLVIAVGWRQREIDKPRTKRSSILHGLLIVSCWTALIASPWYLRTLLWTGNPVFPFGYSILGGRNWTAGAAAYFRHLQLVYGMGHSPLALILAPWRLVTNPVPFYEPAGLALFSVIYGSIGPSFLLLPGLLALRGGWRRTAAWLSLLFALFFVEWFVLMQQVRYLICALPLLAPSCGLALSSLTSRGDSSPTALVSKPSSFLELSRSAAALILTLSFLWTTFWMIDLYAVPSGLRGSSNTSSALLVDLGLESRDDYLSDRLGDLWPVSTWVARNVPPGEPVALVREPRGFYMNHETLWADGYEQEKLRYETMQTPEELANALRHDGIHWIVIRLGSPLGLAASLGEHAKREAGKPLRWDNIIYTGADGHWAQLYAAAVKAGLIVQQYPDPSSDPSEIITDLGGYVVYKVK